MAGPTLPPPDLRTEHAYVIEYRPLDRCFPPACRLRTRDVAGFGAEIQEDGEPGAYVAQGSGLEKDFFFQRGVYLRAGESFTFDLPAAPHASELDAMIASWDAGSEYHADIVLDALPAVGAPTKLETVAVHGRTAPFAVSSTDETGRYARYGKHVRLPLPSRASTGLRVTVTNRGTHIIGLGAPLVMRRVEGRGARQGLVVIHDAVPFHEARAFLFGGMRDANADWVSRTVAERGVYFPAGQSPGQGTAEFVVRFFRGSYFAAWGWPAMWGKGFDETLPAVLPGPIARAAEQGFVTSFVGNNFTLLPNFSHVGWDVSYQSELPQHPAAMARFVEEWAAERPHDDVMMVWWNSATHAPHPPGREGSPPPAHPSLPEHEVNPKATNGAWRNLLGGADHLRTALEALRRSSPRASRVLWIGADHSTGSTKKMQTRAYRVPTTIATGLSHTCGGTIEEAETPFAVVFDGAETRGSLPAVAPARTSSFVAWRVFEARFGIDLGLPQTSTFRTNAFGLPLPSVPDWDDRIMVSAGYTGTMRATLGTTSYALFEGRLSQKPVWSLASDAEQYVLLGAPTRSRGMQDEELYDDAKDPYEYTNVAGERFDDTLQMRREMVDWMAAHWDDHTHPRHRYKLVFSEPTEVDLFAPHPFTALVDDAPVPSADPRMAHVRAREVVIVEGAETASIVEVRGAKGPLVLTCSANGLPLDMLSADRPRFNLTLARTNCPLKEGPHDRAAPGEVLFSFEPAGAARPGGAAPSPPGRPALPNARSAGQNDELLAGMKRWGYVRDIDEKKK